jgi:hypothetical protein
MTLDELLVRIRAPHEELRLLIELGYRSQQEAEREAAGRLDNWLSRQAFDLDMARLEIDVMAAELALDETAGGRRCRKAGIRTSRLPRH